MFFVKRRTCTGWMATQCGAEINLKPIRPRRTGRGPTEKRDYERNQSKPFKSTANTSKIPMGTVEVILSGTGEVNSRPSKPQPESWTRPSGAAKRSGLGPAMTGTRTGPASWPCSRQLCANATTICRSSKPMTRANLSGTSVADATSGADALEYFRRGGGLAARLNGRAYPAGEDWVYTRANLGGLCRHRRVLSDAMLAGKAHRRLACVKFESSSNRPRRSRLLCA